MPINEIERRGFIKVYGKSVNKLTTDIAIFPVASIDKELRIKPYRITALWDTGATISAIKPHIMNQLKLQMSRTHSTKKIAGIGGLVTADFTFINLQLSYNFFIEYCPVYVIDLPCTADMIVGMDLIGMGDFAICNTDNKTSFTFAIPPFPNRLDFAGKIAKDQ